MELVGGSVMNEGNQILVVSDQDTTKEQLKNTLKDYQRVQYIYPQEIMKEIDRIAPDIVLVFKPENESSVDLIQNIRSETPQSKLIFMTESEDFDLLREVTRAGALDFFVIPNELSMLNERVGSIIQLIQRQQSQEETSASTQSFIKGRGQVYSFYSGKGGSGKSLLASTFAQTLKLESTAKVIAVDLNLQFGGVETYLGLESNRSLTELKPVIDELNESHIRNAVEREEHSSLELLLSPRDAEAAEGVTEDFVSKLIRACRRSYDFVIIDLPTIVDETTYIALEESDIIYYIMNLDTPSFQVFKHVEMLFQRLNIDISQRLELVINQVAKENELKASDLKKFINSNIASEIRRDFKGVQAVINQSQPLRTQQREKKLIPVAKDIRKWVLTKI